MKRAVLALVSLLMLASVSAFAQTTTIPPAMNFQGRLAKPDGTPVPDSSYQITFSIFAAASGGTALWTQTINSVAVHHGAFAVRLGDGNPLTTLILNGTPYLEIKVSNDAPLPRQPFASVAFAFKANSVPDGSITTANLAPGALNFANISGTISSSQIGAGILGAGSLSASQQLILGLLSFPVSSPVLKSTTSVPVSPVSIAASGKYVYIGESGFGSNSNLSIYDVTNPAAPVFKNAITTSGAPNALAAADGYAYFVTAGFPSGGSLSIYDVSAPASPVLKSATTIGSGFFSGALAGGAFYLVNSSNNTLQIYDVSVPAAPVLKSTITTGSSPRSVAVGGGLAYVTNYSGSSLQVFDVSNLGSPILKSTTALSASPDFVAASGNYAYIISNAGISLQIFDASVPTAPVLKNTIASGAPTCVTVKGSTLCVVASSVLSVYDISSPASPVLAGTAATGSGASAAAISGGAAYVINANGGAFQAFQVSVGLTINSSLQVNGGGVFSGTVTANGVTLSSDARYKTNIAALNNALDDVLNLRGVAYDFDRKKWPEKNFSDTRQIGFIAQDIEKIFPELVSTDAQGYKAVNYIGVIPVAVEAIKTLNAKVDAQQKQIDDLKAQVRENTEIKKQLAELAAALKKMQEAQNR